MLLLFSSLLNAKFNFTSKSSTFGLSDTNSFLILNRNMDTVNGTISLPDEAPGRISGYKIIFSDGVLRNSSTYCDLSMNTTYDLATTNSIITANGDVIYPSLSQNISKPITVSSGATVSMGGGFILSSPITLTDSTSVLKLSVNTPINQNIVLNGGKVILQNVLAMGSGVQFIGAGTIDIAGNELMLSTSNPFTGAVTFLNANGIVLSGSTTVSTQMTFQGVGLSSIFQGAGNSLTFNPGSSIVVAPNHTLYISDLNIKNFGPNTGSFGFLNIDSTSTVVFENCSIELKGNYTHSAGTIIFKGNNSKIISRGFTWTTSTNNAFITVYGTALEYDNLDQPNAFPFAWTNETLQKSFLNNGNIRPAFSLSSQNLSGTSNSMYRDYYLSEYSNLNFLNPTPASPVAMSYNCNNYNIFGPPSGSGSMINIAANLTLTLSNVNLVNFNKNIVNLATSTSGLVFGAGTSISLAADTTIAPSDFIWTFNSGNSQIVGSGNILSLTGSKRISVTNSGTLTLKNLTLTLTYSDSIACLDNSSTIVFENATVALGANGFYFDTGNLHFKGNCSFQGGDTASASNIALFTFASSGLMTIASASHLRINRFLELKYMANPALDAGLLFISKRHLVMTDLTSALILEGCNLHSTTTGLAIDYGRIVIEDRVSFIIDGSGPTNAEIKSSTVNLEIKAGSNLEVYGELAIK